MPQIPAMVLGQDALDSSEIYSSPSGDGSVYDAGSPNHTLEALNGALDKNNLEDDLTIKPWMVQVGTFAKGAYWGTDRWEFVYASQSGNIIGTYAGESVTHTKMRLVSASLSQSVFIPFEASVVLYGYQAFFRGDATRWDADGSPDDESWDVHLDVNGTTIDSQRVILAHGRTANEDEDDDLPAGSALTLQTEERFRWVEKSGMYTRHTEPGFFNLQVEIGARIRAPDQRKAKVQITTAAAWVLALR